MPQASPSFCRKGRIGHLGSLGKKSRFGVDRREKGGHSSQLKG